MTAINEVVGATVVDVGALLDAGDGAVVTLMAGETQLAAHRAILAARSPVFATMFGRDMLEASSGQVTISDVEGPVLRQLLAFMYTLQAPQVPSMAPQLLAAADKYGLTALKAVCEQQVVAQLDIENAAAAAVLAVRYSCPRLTETAITFIKSNFQVLSTKGWADAMRNQLEDMIEVTRLLTEASGETSGPATGDNRPAAAAITQPHGDRGRRGPTPIAAVAPTARHVSPPADGGVASRMRPPASGGGGTSKATQPPGSRGGTAAPKALLPTAPPDEENICGERAPDNGDSSRAAATTQALSGHGQTAVSAAPAPAPRRTRPSAVAATSHVHPPAAAASRSAAPASTQPHSGDRRLPPAAAASAPAATPPPDGAAVSRLRSLSGEEKGRMLIVAAKEGAVEEVQTLLAAGADVGVSVGDRVTALHWAAERGHLEVVSRLVAGGADVDARDIRQSTPLHRAAESGRAAVVRLLLGCSADQNAGQGDGATPLHLAAASGDVAVVRLLLATAADPNARNQWGWTPLHSAAARGHAQVAAALLEAGADRTATTNELYTPLDFAKRNRYPKLTSMLI